jgi:hypothetical protein
MRRYLVLALVLTLGTAVSAGAQTAVGIKGGVAIANFSVTENGHPPETPYEARNGILLGGTVEIGLTPWLAVQVEGRYSQEGSRQTEMGTTASVRLAYLSFPVVAKARIANESSPVVPYLFAGAFVGFKTQCSVEVEGAISLDLACEELDVSPPSNDYGALFGGGVEVSAGQGALTLDGGYSLGRKNLADGLGVDAFSRVLAVTIGYKFIL